MKLRPHLHFRGNCEEALTHYQRTLGGKIVSMLPYGRSPASADVPKDWQEKIVHATLTFGESELAGADVRPEQYERPQGFSLLVSVPDEREGRRIFDALAEGGRVTFPFGKTFWSPGFGVLVDRFDVPWEVSVDGSVAP